MFAKIMVGGYQGSRWSAGGRGVTLGEEPLILDPEILEERGEGAKVTWHDRWFLDHPAL